MALSVLHKKSLYNDADCGVWCSDKQDWVFNGSFNECFRWKHEQEEKEQDILRQEWKNNPANKLWLEK